MIGTVYRGRVYILYICAWKNNIKKKSLDFALFCCKARWKRIEQERRPGGKMTRSQVFLITSWVFCSVLLLNTKRYILYECLQCWVLLTYVRLQYHWVWKPLNLARSISLLASVHVIRTSIIELGMFTNLCLVLPLLLARLFWNFSFN